jgi:hypothetical protein
MRVLLPAALAIDTPRVLFTNGHDVRRAADCGDAASEIERVLVLDEDLIPLFLEFGHPRTKHLGVVGSPLDVVE